MKYSIFTALILVNGLVAAQPALAKNSDEVLAFGCSGGCYTVTVSNCGTTSYGTQYCDSGSSRIVCPRTISNCVDKTMDKVFGSNDILNGATPVAAYFADEPETDRNLPDAMNPKSSGERRKRLKTEVLQATSPSAGSDSVAAR